MLISPRAIFRLPIFNKNCRDNKITITTTFNLRDYSMEYIRQLRDLEKELI